MTKVQVYVTQSFDDFIKLGSFTQKNLEEFERNLLNKLQDFMKKEGITMAMAPKIRGNANGATHVRSLSGKFKHALRADQNFDDEDMGKGRFSMRN